MQHHAKLLHLGGLLTTIGLLLLSHSVGHAEERNNRGFTPGSGLSVELLYTSIDRASWWLGGHGTSMPGGISLSSGGTSEGGDNKVMIYGDRNDPLIAGESDWQMTPRPALLYFSEGETEKSFTFPFGPPCMPPQGALVWHQSYGYTAACNLDDGGTASGSNSLDAADSL